MGYIPTKRVRSNCVSSIDENKVVVTNEGMDDDVQM